MVSHPVFVCAVVLTLRLFVHCSLFLCVRILFVDAVHTRGPQQFNTTHIAYTGFKHDIFSLALMNIFGFHAINSAFSKCFPKKGKEQNHSSAHPFSRFWKYGICLFTSEFYLLMLSTLVVRNNSTQHILHTRYEM
jgi:hypothetical protein